MASIREYSDNSLIVAIWNYHALREIEERFPEIETDKSISYGYETQSSEEKQLPLWTLTVPASKLKEIMKICGPWSERPKKERIRYLTIVPSERKVFFINNAIEYLGHEINQHKNQKGNHHV